MTEPTEWEWRQEDPTEFEELDAVELHGVYALGELSGVAALVAAESDEDEGPMWQYYSVYSEEREGFGGYEHIDSFATLEEAKSFGDELRDDILAVVRGDL